MANRTLLSFAFLITASLQICSALRDLRLGILIVKNETTEELFCVRYFPNFYNFTSKREEVVYQKLDDTVFVGNNVSSCHPLSNVANKFVFIDANISDASQNCSLSDRLANVKFANGTGLIVNSSLAVFRTNEDEEKDLNLPVAALTNPKDLQRLLDLRGQGLEFGIWTPADNTFDSSLIVILLMAVTTIGLGSLWSGYVKHHLRLRQTSGLSALRQDETNGPDPAEGGSGSRRGSRYGERREDEEHICEQTANNQSNEELSMRISPAYVVFFVVLMCSMLILLYFFFDFLVYFIIGMFCLASTIAVYSCFEPFVMWTYECCPSCPTVMLPRCNFRVCILNMELRQLLLLLAAISISTVWVVFRNHHWAWTLQDFLGILFSINMLKVLRFPSLKICTILLSILFIYDIFFVFITPHITSNGKSIMVEVATGGDTGEQLPMVLKVPHLNCAVGMKTCRIIPYSMLGFGDILVPGLLLSYCHSYDLYRETPYRLYWLITTISYVLGLIATFVSLYFMEAAQPALLYLVPFTLIPVVIVSLIRGEFHDMWKGDVEVQEQPTEEANEIVQTNNANPTLPGSVEEITEQENTVEADPPSSSVSP